MGYDLEQWGTTGFQDLATALLLDTFGPGVQVMVAGRNGGRDLYHKGQPIWQATEDQAGEVWQGYTAFQVKRKQSLELRRADNTAWLWSQVHAELDAGADPASRRDPVPDHLVMPSSTTVGRRTVESMVAVNRRCRGLLADRRDLPAPSLHLPADGPGFCLHEPLARCDRRTARLLEEIHEIGTAGPRGTSEQVGAPRSARGGVSRRSSRRRSRGRLR